MARPVRDIDFHDRLLAEAVRAVELSGAAEVEDAQANASAREAGGDLERRIVNRAWALAIAGQLQTAIENLNRVFGWTIALGALLAVAAGAGTARATLGVDGRGVANFYWVLGGILGVQTIALLIWSCALLLGFWLARQGKGTGRAAGAVSLGSIVLGAAQWLMRKLHQDGLHVAAGHAAVGVHSRGAIGRWTFSSITHGLWLGFNVGCLVMVIVLLSARQYTFVWETTILTERHYVQLTRTIAAVPKAAGFTAPSEQEIAASRKIEGQPLPDVAREAWSGLLVGCIVVYGFGPRLVLLGLSLGCRRGAKKRFRLEVGQPGYAQLEGRLADRPMRLREEDGDDGAVFELVTDEQVERQRPKGGAAIVGIELDQAEVRWPPVVRDIKWADLGVLEDRDDQRRAIETLRDSQTEPARLVIVCDLTTTPDRGITRLVHQLAEEVTTPPLLILSGGQTLRSRGLDAAGVAQRVGDWRTLAKRAGLSDEHVVEIDLEHLTDQSVHRLAELIGVDYEDVQADGVSGRRINAAFERIVEHVQQWQKRGLSGEDTAAQAELHREIAKIYRGDDRSDRSWGHLLGLPASLDVKSFDAGSLDVKDFAATVKDSAQRFTQLLPERLKRSPKWLAAGALSGALGCVAAATLISPVAIAALPTWSLIGAAVAAALQKSGGDVEKDDAGSTTHYDRAVHAAALFALLLELQGRDEATITSIFDQVLEDDIHGTVLDGATDSAGVDVIRDAADTRRYLDQLRHRVDVALAEGQG